MQRTARLALLLAAATARLLTQEVDARAGSATGSDPGSPWAIADGWRLGHGGSRRLAFVDGAARIELVARGHGGDYTIEVDGGSHAVSGARFDGDALSARIDGGMRRFHAMQEGDDVLVHVGRQRLRLHAEAVYRRAAGDAGSAEHRIRAPMPGRVVLVQKQAGETVAAGDVVLVIEAMKMELALKAPRDGVLADVRAQAGDFVEGDAVLALLEE